MFVCTYTNADAVLIVLPSMCSTVEQNCLWAFINFPVFLCGVQHQPKSTLTVVKTESLYISLFPALSLAAGLMQHKFENQKFFKRKVKPNVRFFFFRGSGAAIDSVFYCVNFPAGQI